MQFGPDRPKRRLVSLTPMIDVVFLLLVFFMLASRFADERAVTLTGGAGGGAGAPWEGPPRLLTLSNVGAAFNGAPVSLTDLAQMLTAQGVGSDQTILVRPLEGADMQSLTDVLDALADGGFGRAVVTP